MQCATSGARPKSVLYRSFRWSGLITGARLYQGRTADNNSRVYCLACFWSLPSVLLISKSISSDKKQDRTKVVKGRIIQDGRVAMICDFDHQICQSCVFCTNCVKKFHIGSGTWMGTLPTPVVSSEYKMHILLKDWFQNIER